MTYLVDRLAELRRHLDHLYELRTRVRDASSLRQDMSLVLAALNDLDSVERFAEAVRGLLASLSDA